MIGSVVLTKSNKYYIILETFGENLLGINFHDYKEKAELLTPADILSVVEKPDNVEIFLFKRVQAMAKKLKASS